MFCRESSWVLQTPDLSRIKREAQAKDLKMLFESAKEIQTEMCKQVEKRRSSLVKTIELPKLKKNDVVRIKKFAVGKDINKKAFRPFSETTWNVQSVNPFTNTCLLMENVDEGYQPRQRRIHIRFLRKIAPVIADKGDDLSMTTELDEDNKGRGRAADEHDKTEECGTSSNMKAEKSKTPKKVRFKDEEISKTKENTSKIQERSRHHMNLRRRK